MPPGPSRASERKLVEAILRGDTALQDKYKDFPEDAVTEVEEEAEYEDDRVVMDVEQAPKLPTTINLFQHPDAHPFVLDLALLRKYGPEWMQWEPDTLELRILTDFRTNSLSDLNMDKLQTLKVMHMVDLFWKNWEVFSPCTQALTGIPPDFSVIQAVTVPQAMIAVDIANRVRGDVQWGLEVKTYLSCVQLHDGMFCPIPPLDFVEVDSEGYDIDCEDIRKRWEEVRATRNAPSSTTVENEQLRRMLEAWALLEENRAQLQDQLPLLYNA